jgi:MFS family permease
MLDWTDICFSIVFRAFQGVGGGGLYSLAMGVATEVPGEVRSPINGILSSTFAISSAIGPLIGGAIASNTTWRWVFLLK